MFGCYFFPFSHPSFLSLCTSLSVPYLFFVYLYFSFSFLEFVLQCFTWRSSACNQASPLQVLSASFVLFKLSWQKKKKSIAITTSSREKPGFAPERPKRPNFGRRGVGTADDRSVMSSIFIRVFYVGLLGPDRCPTIAGGVVGPLGEKGPQNRVPSTSSLSVSVHCCNHWTNTAVSERG